MIKKTDKKTEQKYSNLKQELYEYLGTPVKIPGYQLPQMLTDTAVEIFMRKDYDSEIAQKVRDQLEYLKKTDKKTQI